MNTTEYLLTKVMEECDEVGQRVAKALCFGLDESQPGQEMTNADRINYELNDLAAVLEMLEDRGIFVVKCDPLARAHKREKLEKYMRYSRDVCGTLKDEEGR
jgi:hypothetical protein